MLVYKKWQKRGPGDKHDASETLSIEARSAVREFFKFVLLLFEWAFYSIKCECDFTFDVKVMFLFFKSRALFLLFHFLGQISCSAVLKESSDKTSPGCMARLTFLVLFNHGSGSKA